MSEGLVDVCLEGILTSFSNKNTKHRIEIISLSHQEAMIHLAVPIALGEKVYCVFQSSPSLELEAKISRFVDWKRTPTLVVLEFSNLSLEIKAKIQEITDYYSQLKKAGVQFGIALSQDGKFF